MTSDNLCMHLRYQFLIMYDRLLILDHGKSILFQHGSGKICIVAQARVPISCKKQDSL